MAARCDRSATPQHHLVAHELAIVLADGTRGRAKARIRSVGARRPFPNIAKHLPRRFVIGCCRRCIRARMKMPAIGEITRERQAYCRGLPLGFCRQALPSPFREGVGLVIADMASGLRRVQATASRQSKNRPFRTVTTPIKGGFPV